MNSGVGESSLCGKLLWTPTVYSRIDVTTMAASSISFRRFLFILNKPYLISESCSCALSLKVMHLHYISFGWKMASYELM